ncbi:histidine kinase dimerization/phospho-acceptor domain-containing protein [Paenibacillus sp. P22]|uniref:histidine kinase dimerization/phospho-acceptor domain-containing protein n=1 Tax=Paenibacillus sp. P22 TaxID=483908 RepID=UPI00038FE566|nr:histidine kinase dimerization/phospho-acceptor domain-containing protein [Paenibacillus sp. P22]CDN41373.1 hypothetical protein BN871_AF_00290 [Paenibacillus sp. P22]
MTELTHDHLAEEENVRLPMDALLTGISKLIDADAYFVSERQGNEEHVAHLHHKGEPILHCGLEVDEPEAGAEGDTWLGFHYCGLQVRTGGKASTGTLGLLRREAAFTEMEKAVLQMAAARWLLQKESGLEEESLEDKRRLEAISSANARLEKDKDQLYELGLEMITPMTGISGMAELLAETELTDEQRSYVDTIIGSSGYLIQLIQHMMANSRMAAGSVDRRITPFSLHLLLAGSRASDPGGRGRGAASGDAHHPSLGSRLRRRAGNGRRPCSCEFPKHRQRYARSALHDLASP